MTRALTPTRIAELAVESAARDWATGINGPSEQGPLSTDRPAGVRLDNDGSQEYWLAPGQRWTLAFDGTGWQATTPGWGEGHVYRIADASGPEGSYISWLPTADGGRVDLVPGKEYQVAWESIEDLSHPPQQSRSAVILSTLG